jgi:hypothetical protein
MENNFKMSGLEELNNEQMADINGGGFWHDLGYAIGDFLYDFFHPTPTQQTFTF